MQWYRVEIHKHEALIAGASATTLMEALGAAYRAAGIPGGVNVYQCSPTPFDVTFYLSPAAASLIESDLITHNAARCDPPSDLSDFWEVKL